MTKQERKELKQALGMAALIALSYIVCRLIWDRSLLLLLIFFALSLTAGWRLAVFHQRRH